MKKQGETAKNEDIDEHVS